MNENTKDLIRESLEIEDDFSSTSHIINSIASEITPVQNKYDIPSRYNKNRLVILPVNTNTYFVYWEVDDETINSNNIDLKKEKLYFKIFDNNNKLLTSFDSSFALGEQFVYQNFENIKVYVKLYLAKDGEEKEILSSNIVHTFSNQIKIPDKDSEVWIKRTKGWTEIVRSSMQHFTLGMSSAKYVEEIEQLRQYNEFEKENMSSFNIHKGKQND